jgi:hypothetical protein
MIMQNREKLFKRTEDMERGRDGRYFRGGEKIADRLTAPSAGR